MGQLGSAEHAADAAARHSSIRPSRPWRAAIRAASMAAAREGEEEEQQEEEEEVGNEGTWHTSKDCAKRKSAVSRGTGRYGGSGLEDAMGPGAQLICSVSAISGRPGKTGGGTR